ncbi:MULTISPECIES: lipase family protein [Pseudoalteromonas]|uniref:lipase family protein n=1 Tax=Pseudoalteromonas TaxID=53246 RepID=UPI000C323FDB|nr:MULTISPECIES: lipase family protein [Pseudoalteromonas]MBH0000372.1 lipase family protein [Pseudoalteromonas sp. NSLLW24]MBH0079368.1 lipase family protein [Pseudoalteromonas sp. NZS11]PKG64593.1 lipase [Pseudoalteromonas arctica]PKG71701.1 lipase [Pseudoalteromonas sp. GutCa3]
MNTLTPTQAVQIATLAYKAKSIKSTKLLNNSLHPSLRGNFNFGVNQDAVQGISGGFFSHLFGLSTGFGLLGHGQGDFQGDSVITIRGTASLRDGLTDANFGLSGGSNGSMVHAGFNKTFYSMKPAIQEFVSANVRDKMTGCVHVVGHSLGGALAALSADWIKAEYSLPVKLYTFGSPRVGLEPFSRATTSRLDKIYRCTHGADPVAKVPLWPFSHAPYNGQEIRLDNGQGLKGAAHKLNGTPGYINTANSNDWNNLTVKANHFLSTPVRLKFEDRNQASFGSQWADKLNAALITLLKDAGYYSAVAAQAAIGTSLTFYDMLSRTVSQIAKASASFAAQTLGLLGHMLAFVGKVITGAVELTYNFIRSVFDDTLKALYRAAKDGLNGLD